MGNYKFLIDTNIFIGLEDAKLIDSGYAEFFRTCQKYAVRLFVHEAAIEDIKRDRDTARRDISLSKLQKFETLFGIKTPNRAVLEASFGPIRGPNDEVDVALLVALERDAVDFLITQDVGIHDRGELSTLAKRILRVSDALAWLRQNFEPTEIKLPLVKERVAHEIDPNDDIFPTLREGYDKFDEWWRKCVREHRLCWTIEIGPELAGICVRKDETRSEATVSLPGNRILKLCTFKIKSKFRGEKLGELLLKQALWFAQRNSYELVYLTTKPEQQYLIQLIQYYGFCRTQTLDDSEAVYEKSVSGKRLNSEDSEIFLVDRLNYPRFVTGPPVSAYCVPIRGLFHRKLFPEIAFHNPLPLFPGQSMFRAGPSDARTPGNTIRKVYVCRTQTSSLQPGDLLFFYQSKTREFAASQAITSIGIVEAVHSTSDLDELIRLTAKRSVYSELELREILRESDAPVKVIDFLLTGHFDNPINLNELRDLGVLKRAPQSICRLSTEPAVALLSRLSLGFQV
jgi:Acetyltransferase (GNAT) family